MSQSSPDGSLLAQIANYTEILAKKPNSTIFVSLAEAYRRMGLLDEAYNVASKGIRALPKYGPGYTVLGRVYAQRGDGFAAAASFEKALRFEPESLPAFKGLVKVLLADGEKQQALEVVEKAVQIHPEDPALQKVLASFRSSASQAVTPVAAEAPEMAETAEVVETAETPPAEPPPAAARSRRPVSLRPQVETIDPITTATIADIYIRQGFPQRALKVYRDLLKADPHNVEIREKLVALKLELEAQAETEVSPEAAPMAVQASAAEPAPAEPTVDATPAAPAVVDQKSGRMRHLETLNRWLEAIRLRREYV